MKFSRSSLGILEGCSSGIFTGVPWKFLQEFLGNTCRTFLGVPLRSFQEYMQVFPFSLRESLLISYTEIPSAVLRFFFQELPQESLQAPRKFLQEFLGTFRGFPRSIHREHPDAFLINSWKISRKTPRKNPEKFWWNFRATPEGFSENSWRNSRETPGRILDNLLENFMRNSWWNSEGLLEKIRGTPLGILEKFSNEFLEEFSMSFLRRIPEELV